MGTRTTIAFLVWAFTAVLCAQPANVLVGDLTFMRPEKWKWDAPVGNSSAETRFLIPGTDSSTPIDVRFYVEPRESRHSDKAWKAMFRDARGPNVIEERREIGSRTISFLTLKGTYFPGPKVKPKPKHQLINVTIPFQDQVIRVRILGPEAQVKKASADFRQMIETALQEAQ